MSGLIRASDVELVPDTEADDRRRAAIEAAREQRQRPDAPQGLELRLLDREKAIMRAFREGRS